MRLVTKSRASRRPVRQRTARIVTEVFAPGVLVSVLLLAVGLHAAGGPSGLLWGLLAALFASITPMAYILRGVRRGHWTDHHVTVREQRRLPLLVGLASVVVGLGLLIWLKAPRELLALVAAMVAGLGVTVLVTHWWKISVHTAVAAGTVVVLTLVFGPWLLFLWAVVALIAWSRVELRDHTIGQVLGGIPFGAIVAGLIFTLAR
jgi:membrane-associated phospholipid phosphatase